MSTEYEKIFCLVGSPVYRLEVRVLDKEQFIQLTTMSGGSTSFPPIASSDFTATCSPVGNCVYAYLWGNELNKENQRLMDWLMHWSMSSLSWGRGVSRGGEFDIFWRKWRKCQNPHLRDNMVGKKYQILHPGAKKTQEYVPIQKIIDTKNIRGQSSFLSISTNFMEWKYTWPVWKNA